MKNPKKGMTSKELETTVQYLKAEIDARESAHAKTIRTALQPSISLLCKLASAVAHVEEGMCPGGHHFDWVVVKELISDPEITAWIEEMKKAAFVPVKRG